MGEVGPSMKRWMWALCLSSCVACGGDAESTLRVDLRTDYLAAVEFDAIEIALSTGGGFESTLERGVMESDDFVRARQ